MKERPSHIFGVRCSPCGRTQDVCQAYEVVRRSGTQGTFQLPFEHGEARALSKFPVDVYSVFLSDVCHRVAKAMEREPPLPNRRRFQRGGFLETRRRHDVLKRRAWSKRPFKKYVVRTVCWITCVAGCAVRSSNTVGRSPSVEGLSLSGLVKGCV